MGLEVGGARREDLWVVVRSVHFILAQWEATGRFQAGTYPDSTSCS